MLALAACARGPMPPGSSIPPSIEVRGRAVPFDSLSPFRLASVPSRASTRLTVFAIGNEKGGGPCGPPVLRLSAEETATTVRVSVAGYQDPIGTTTACPAIGYGAGPNTIALARPIGSRKVVDAATGKAPTLLVAADHPRLVAPRGFVALPFGLGFGASTTIQVWDGRGHGDLALETTTPTAARDQSPYGRIIRRFSIAGSPATVYSTGGRSARWQVRWTPNRRQTITLRLDDHGDRRWSVDEAQALARSVTNYRTEQTDRLPLPALPGTTVASWSSADGPVRHAPNMWKSSGIFVGVRCDGAGTVTVSLRGRTHPFSCGATATEHVIRTDGAPDAVFFVDVSSTPSVRWTVALARASLDGS